MRRVFGGALLVFVACGPESSTDQGLLGGSTGQSSNGTSSSTGRNASSDGTTGDASSDPTDEPGGVSGHACPEDCCHDAVTFAIEDGRESFALTFEISALIVVPIVSCPSATVEEVGYWEVECDGGEVTIDGGYGGFTSPSLMNIVRLDGGEPQFFGDELDSVSCDCNCQPLQGRITVLLDPAGGSTSTGSSSTGTGGSTSTSGSRVTASIPNL